MATQAQSEWVRRVLGVDPAALAAADGQDASGPPVEAGMAAAGDEAPVLAAGDKLLPFWVSAKEQADARLSRFQATLRQFDDPDLTQVIEFGLNGITNRRSVGLMVALREADADATPEARRKLAGAVAQFRDFLEGEPIVDLLEEAPFGASVPLRSILGSALDQIDRRLAA